MHNGSPVSWMTDHRGSQCPSAEWIEGRRLPLQLSFAGFSLKMIPRDPLSAQRCTSRTDASTSQNGTSVAGMNRPGAVAHHSSIIQSFHARMHHSPSSRSSPSMNVCPAKRGKLGKFNEANTPAWSMSSSRAFGCQQPGRMSS